MIDDFDLGSAEEYYGNVAELADAAGLTNRLGIGSNPIV